jgi:hypothetical protein
MGIRLAPMPGEPRPPKVKPPKPVRQTRARSALVPAAARSTPTLTALELTLSGDAIETFARAVGGRQQLLETLAVADSDSSNDKVINCLLDDQYASWSLRRICNFAGITVADLFASYKKALVVKAHLEATHIIASKLPPIVDDVMTRATPLVLVCPSCAGLPAVEGAPACPVCAGSGQVLSEPDLDRQKLALELGRLTNQHKGGVVVQQNVAAGTAWTGQGVGGLEQLQQAVGDLLFAPGRRRAAAPTIEAAVVEPEPPPPGRPGPQDVPLPFGAPDDDDRETEEEDESDADDTLST